MKRLIQRVKLGVHMLCTLFMLILLCNLNGVWKTAIKIMHVQDVAATVMTANMVTVMAGALPAVI